MFSKIFHLNSIISFILTINSLCHASLDRDQKNNSSSSINRLLTDPIDVKITVGQVGSFNVYLTKKPEKPISINFKCVDIYNEVSPCTTFNNSIVDLELSSKKMNCTINFLAHKPGHDVIILVNHDPNINTEMAFVRIRVGRGKFWTVLGDIFGWGYFFIWSLSFWPQNFTNYFRKSVIGLSFDYTILHFTGFIYYSIFNIGLYAVPIVQEEYERKFPHSEIPVELNDVVYALHAAFTTAITFIQLFIYEKGSQRFALISKLFQASVWSIGTILLILASFRIVTWLTWIYFFSYVKLIVTSTKYLPQAIFNFKRKSTSGWTINMILLDIVGGSLSMLQMLTVAFNYDDWRTLIGNLPKFGLGLASVLYDIIFMLQHYVLYRHSPAPSTPSTLSEKEIAEIEDQQRRETLKSIQNIIDFNHQQQKQDKIQRSA